MEKTKLPGVLSCGVKSCVYNRDRVCHVAAITVAGALPRCETYVSKQLMAGINGAGSVGACKAEKCRFNDKLECNAESIEIAERTCFADCLTYNEKITG